MCQQEPPRSFPWRRREHARSVSTCPGRCIGKCRCDCIVAAHPVSRLVHCRPNLLLLDIDHHFLECHSPAQEHRDCLAATSPNGPRPKIRLICGVLQTKTWSSQSPTSSLVATLERCLSRNCVCGGLVGRLTRRAAQLDCKLSKGSDWSNRCDCAGMHRNCVSASSLDVNVSLI